MKQCTLCLMTKEKEKIVPVLKKSRLAIEPNRFGLFIEVGSTFLPGEPQCNKPTFLSDIETLSRGKLAKTVSFT